MFKYRVLSGEFEIIIEESTLRKAGDAAIQVHNRSNHPSKLGELTLVEKLNRLSQRTGDHIFISTQILLDANTQSGQYSRVEEKDA
jgi:hypothetical protein